MSLSSDYNEHTSIVLNMHEIQQHELLKCVPKGVKISQEGHMKFLTGTHVLNGKITSTFIV